MDRRRRVPGTAWDVGKFNLIIIKLTRYKAPNDSKECQQRGKGERDQGGGDRLGVVSRKIGRENSALI